MRTERDADAERCARLLAHIGEETDEDGRILKPSFAVVLVQQCWRGSRRVKA